MANYITRSSGVRINIRTLIVRPLSETRKILTQLLDGTYTVQQIGSAATKLDITVTTTDKSELGEICSICETITVNHYGTAYTGIISSEGITWEPVIPGNRYYRGTFSVAVIE